MVPNRIVELETFPLTPNGKFDRQALSRPGEPVSREAPRGERPRGQIEVGLEAVLKALLGVGQAGRHDHFLDIGGHSVLAVRYFSEIHKIYGVSLPVSTLLQAGSIALLAQQIEKQQRQRHETNYLVPIQAGGTKPKFFCVHGTGGNVLFYRELSRTLGNDFPFYGLQARGLDGVSEPLSSVEDMASVYVEAIRAVQAEGPYHLGGYCLGGVIAYEVARLLKAQGEDVALLALLDTYNFDRVKRSNILANLAQRARFHLGNLLQVPFTQWGAYLRHKLRISTEGELNLIMKSFFSSTRVATESGQDHVHFLNCQAAIRYRPQPYQGVVTNFKPKRNYSAFADPDMGWSELALGGVKNIELDLNPHAMLTEPFVAQLADTLSQELSSTSDRVPRGVLLRRPKFPYSLSKEAGE